MSMTGQVMFRVWKRLWAHVLQTQGRRAEEQHGYLLVKDRIILDALISHIKMKREKYMNYIYNTVANK